MARQGADRFEFEGDDPWENLGPLRKGGKVAKRDEWEVMYPVDHILDAVGVKIAYHTERESYWRREKLDREAAFREKGIDVNAIAEDMLSNKVTNYSNVSGINLDHDLLASLQEAIGKIADHKKKKEHFQLFQRFIGQHEKQQKNHLSTGKIFLPLTIADAEAFGL